MELSLRTQDCFHKVLSHSLASAASSILSATSMVEDKAKDVNLDSSKMSRIMLTIAGIDFRMTFLLHYSHHDRLASLIKTGGGDEGTSKMSRDLIEAYFLELGNRFCGEAKRLCYESFDYLGMSTPCVLSQTTTLNDMRSEDLKYESHLHFHEANLTLLGGSVYVYCRKILNFNLDDSHFSEQEGTGELEFF